MMESKITIFSVVDVIESLSGGTLLNGNLCMMDNGPFESLNQGTPNLVTLCHPGQLDPLDNLGLGFTNPSSYQKDYFSEPRW
jgi:hypothetical protein